jgi:hypothetical protein
MKNVDWENVGYIAANMIGAILGTNRGGMQMQGVPVQHGIAPESEKWIKLGVIGLVIFFVVNKIWK